MRQVLCAVGFCLLLITGCSEDKATRPAPARECPSGSVKWTNNHCYEAVLATLSWEEAKAACEARGGHLATITSSAENAFVYGLVSGSDAFWFLDYYGNGLGPWLGGYQEPGSAEPNGGWKWVTGEPFIYTHWEDGQPDNAGGSQSVLRFFKAGGLIGDGWDDSELDNPVEHRKGYVCEYD